MSGRSTSILATILFIIYSQNVYSVEFNLDVVDSKSKDNINFARFSEAGYILPSSAQNRVRNHWESPHRPDGAAIASTRLP